MKTLIISLFALYMSVNLQAQNDDFIVTINNDSIYGKVSLYNYKGQQIQLKRGKEKDNFKPHQIKQMIYKDDVYHPIKIRNQYQLAKLLMPGYLSLYKFSEDPHAPILNFDTPVLVKITGEHLEIPNKGFKAGMGEFLQDCEVVVSNLETKKYKRNNIEPLVTDYNKCISENTSVVKNTIAEEKINVKKIIGFESIKERIMDSSKIQNKDDVIEMLTDVQSKIETNNTIPTYLINTLKKTLSADADLLSMFNSFLDK